MTARKLCFKSGLVSGWLIGWLLLNTLVAGAASPTPAPKPTTPSPKPPSPTPTPATPKLVAKAPALNTATAAIAIDADTGRILYAKNAQKTLPMASTTKIMTALTLLSIPGLDLKAETTVVQDDLVGEASMGLQAGERIKLYNLLVGLLTNSANEAGLALARYAGSKVAGPADPVARFVGLMNSQALSLGLYQSHFMNPHGLDEPGHYSTAYDLALSGWYAMHQPTIVSIVQLNTYNFEGHSFFNVNNFLRRYPGATGIKPGLTDEAGRCLVASASNFGHNIIAVILNDSNLTENIDTLMDYAFSLVTNRAELQPYQPLPVYIGFPAKDRLLPVNTAPTTEFLRWISASAGQWLNKLKSGG